MTAASKICIVGAGAIGGFLGARLAATGRHHVVAVARGATLQALRTHGWRLDSGGQRLQAPVHDAQEDPARLGPQDLVIIAVKGPALQAVAAGIGPLLGAHTLVLPAMNGVPWWFCDGLDGPLSGARLASVDPDGAIAEAIPRRHVIGCVVHASTLAPEPGRVQHQMGQGLIVGEPDGGTSPRVEALADTLREAGFETTVSPRIQRDIWYKLWGNLTTNPISAITGATVDRILADDLVRGFCTAAMEEARQVGHRIGCAIEQTPDERHQITRKLGAFKTSMLQDALAGRTLELDSIVGAARELGQRAGVPTPNIDALLGLARLFARVHGLYPEAPAQAGTASAARPSPPGA